MTRLAHKYDAINLAQGFPNFAAPQSLKDAACTAIQADINQYAVTWGAPAFRRAIARKCRKVYDWQVDPEREITVACGATECMIASVLALVNPSEKVIVPEPFYENYGPDSIIAGSTPIYVPMDPKRDWALDFDALESVLSREERLKGVRALILNTPHNPTGRVFSKAELERIARLACRYDFYVLTDEIYEHIIYDGYEHHPIALMEGMRERTVTISGMSKSYSVTGWRVGYIIAPPDLTNAIRKIHDFLTVGAAAPLQEAGVIAMDMEGAYYQRLAADYRQRRDFFLKVLIQCGFKASKPRGAYYIMADYSALSDLSDEAFADQLIREYGVATVPGSSFLHSPGSDGRYVRFAFCKTMDLLEEAAERLLRLQG